MGNFYAEFLKLAQVYGETMCNLAGVDPESPKNPHLANTWHTQMCVHLDQSKDAFIKWVLAATGDCKENECLVEDEWGAALFQASAERKRPRVSQDAK